MPRDSEILASCKDSCASLIDRLLAGEHRDISDATLVALQEATVAMEAELAGTPIQRTRSRFRFGGLRLWGWILLYVATFAGLVWWTEFRPAWDAYRKMQGSWQFTEGTGHDEHLTEVFFQVDGSDTWLAQPHHSKWWTSRSRISIRPAHDFFIVRSKFGFDYGTTREREYIIRLANDHLYRVRGMARLDPLMERKIDKLRPIPALPAEALEEIKQRRQAAK